MALAPRSPTPLTPQTLLRDFGSRSPAAANGIPPLLHQVLSEVQAAFQDWAAGGGRLPQKTAEKLPAFLATSARRWGVCVDEANAAALLFAIQTYYATIVNLVATRFGTPSLSSPPKTPFDWCATATSDRVNITIQQLADAIDRYQLPPAIAAEDSECDLFKSLYQNLFPRSLRHQLGEYYTPDWLAHHVLDQVGYAGDPQQRLLDPACGSGTFLLMALRRLLPATRRPSPSPSPSPPAPDFSSPASHPQPLTLPIVGFDLNPLAVLTARANVQIALAQRWPDLPPVHVPIYCRDSILDHGEGDDAASMPFDHVVGNPPWIAWDNLPSDDRQATKPLWEKYGLFSLSGSEARHGGGKKDLSMLMLYVAADRYLKPTGRLGMVVTQTLFQSGRAGDGFRRFRLGTDGPPLRVLRVDDLVALRPFDASNWTSTIVLEKGQATDYPVPYFKWERTSAVPATHPASCILHPYQASPVDSARPTSPWRIHSNGERGEVPSPLGRGAGGEGNPPQSSKTLTLTLSRPSFARCPERGLPANSPPISSNVRCVASDYAAYLGANSGGANGVFWVNVLKRTNDGALIRNQIAKGKRHVASVEQIIEPDRLYPLLRWGDVKRFAAMPSGHILLTQDVDARTGIPEELMRSQFPLTFAYLEQFRDLLTSRAAYRRYQAAGPFYSMYNVGPYTVAPIKVVWRRMDRRINAAVVESTDDPLLGLRPVIAQETCVILPCATNTIDGDISPAQQRPAGADQSRPSGSSPWPTAQPSDEAHYVCAMMNSAAINELVTAHSIAGGKSFGTPGMLRYLPLRRFDPQNNRHMELSRLSREAHCITAERQVADPPSKIDAALTELQSHIDDVATFEK